MIRASKDPLSPILFAGSLGAPLCILGRDLGKDEVMVGQPLVGAAGRLVRAGVYQAGHGAPPPPSDKTVQSVLDQVLLTNTVPYKPPGNKAYAPAVKERFRPYLAELLAAHWHGYHVITLGTEAFQWFAPYADPATFAAFWERDDRYEAELRCVLSATVAVPGARSKTAKDISNHAVASPFSVEPAVVQAIPRIARPASGCDRARVRLMGTVAPDTTRNCASLPMLRRLWRNLRVPRFKSEKLRVADCQAGRYFTKRISIILVDPEGECRAQGSNGDRP